MNRFRAILAAALVALALCYAQMAQADALQLDFFLAGFQDEDGAPLSGAIVTTRNAANSAAKAVWDDKDKTLPSGAGKAQFTLDSEGRANVYGDGVYTVIIYDSTDTGLTSPLYTFSGVTYETNTAGLDLKVDKAGDTMTGGILFNNGTDSTPSIIFTDTNATSAQIAVASETFKIIRSYQGGGSVETLAIDLQTGELQSEGSKVWTEGNDGPGSLLNADLLDGYDTGNAAGEIPVNDGALNATLNADLLDGLDSSDFVRVGSSASTSIANGSFEQTVSGEPKSWTVTDVNDGTHAINTTTIKDGAKSLAITSTTIGGYAYADSDDFIPIPDGMSATANNTVFVSGYVRQTAATVAVGEVLWFDNAQAPLAGTGTFMSETTLPATSIWYPIRGHADVPTGARYYKVRITGGDGTVGAVTHWDSLATSVRPFDWLPQVISGASNTTHTMSSPVGFPKYVRVETIGSAASALGWDGSTYTTLRAWQTSTEAEVALDAVGAFQTSVAATLNTEIWYR